MALERRLKSIRSQMSLEPRQLKAIRYLLEHKTIKDTAKRLKVGRTTLFRWMQLPQFQEEMKKRAKAMMEIGFSLSLSSSIDWHEAMNKRIRSKDDNTALRACSIYAPVLCKQITQNVSVQGGPLCDLDTLVKDLEAIKAKEKSDA